MNPYRNLCTLAIALFSAAAAAQSYPDRPVHIIVGYSPGGGTDLTARLVAERLSPRLGQPVVVENRPGAGSNIAGAYVAKSAPDGYTLFAAAGGIAVNATLYANMNYHPVKDLAPVAALTMLPNVLVANAELPVKTLAELIAHAKANPSTMSCGSSSVGSTGHLSCELFNQRAGTRILHVPYKGSSGAFAALLGGQVQVVFDQIPTPLPHIKSGRLRAIVLTGPARNANLPDVPTSDEAGLPGFYANTWVSLFAPAGTPAAVIERLNREVGAVLAQADLRERLAGMGMEPAGGSPAKLADMLSSDIAKWAKVIKEANISVAK
ncbi:MAG: tripartite tricarboxylate transporter substrate binding protein [Burkholderiales bacterium]